MKPFKSHIEYYFTEELVNSLKVKFFSYSNENYFHKCYIFDKIVVSTIHQKVDFKKSSTSQLLFQKETDIYE